MGYKKVSIDPEGGELKAEIHSNYGQQGFYTIQIWEANSNKILWKNEGNFINDEDDSYLFKGKSAEYIGRLVDCRVTLILSPPVNNYKITLIISQNNKELDREVEEGENKSGSTTEILKGLYIELIKK